MRYLKKIALGLIAILSILLVIAALMPKKMEITRFCEVNQSSPETYDYLRYLKNHDQFNIWYQKIPQKSKQWIGEDGNINAQYTWTSNTNIGDGSHQIINLEKGSLVQIKTNYHKPFQSTDLSTFQISQINFNKTKVTWTYRFEIIYPFNILIPILNKENIIATEMDKSLDKLQKIKI